MITFTHLILATSATLAGALVLFLAGVSVLKEIRDTRKLCSPQSRRALA